jgi:hypothetical protein
MQSTVLSAPQELSDTRHYLNECLGESGHYESLDSQAETSGRMPELAGFTMMQQSRRMLQRPFSIAGVEMADGNRFFVNLGSQAETCNRPLFFNQAMYQPSPYQPTPQAAAQLPEVTNSKMTAATSSTPFAWDFRAQSNAIDAVCTDRNWDWPALDEGSYRKPEPLRAAKVWSMETSMSRIPAQTVKAKKASADAESLRVLLNEAMERESQRITVRTQAFKPEETPETGASSRFLALCAQASKFLRTIGASAFALLHSRTGAHSS